MATKKLDKKQKQAIIDARNLIAEVLRKDANEAETRRRVERIFEGVMGYDVFEHLSRERAVHGAGDTEHVDFAIQIEAGEEAPPIIMVELKRVGVDLASKHLKQASRYAIDAGCEWVLLTNGRQWHVYHVEFGQPPVTKLVEQWNLLHDEIEILAAKFGLISFKSVKHGALDSLWQTTRVVAPAGLLRAILSPDSITALRRTLRRDTGVAVSADHIVTGLRKMLNDSAATILDDVQVSLPEAEISKPSRKPRSRGPRCRLADLLAARLIEPETVLFTEYKGSRYEATIQPDGTVSFEGATYKTPSAAGGAVTAKHGIHPPNGWNFWQLMDSEGNATALETIRQAYQAKDEEHSPGETEPSEE